MKSKFEYLRCRKWILRIGRCTVLKTLFLPSYLTCLLLMSSSLMLELTVSGTTAKKTFWLSLRREWQKMQVELLPRSIFCIHIMIFDYIFFCYYWWTKYCTYKQRSESKKNKSDVLHIRLGEFYHYALKIWVKQPSSRGNAWSVHFALFLLFIIISTIRL